MEITKVAPFLVKFLEVVATNDHQYNRPKCKAFEVLKIALQVLTNPERKFGLSWELMGILEELLRAEARELRAKDTQFWTRCGPEHHQG